MMLTLTKQNDNSYGYMSVVRIEVYNKGEYNDLYVYMTNKAQAQVLAFSELIECCLLIDSRVAKDKDYKYIVRVRVPSDVNIEFEEE